MLTRPAIAHARPGSRLLTKDIPEATGGGEGQGSGHGLRPYAALRPARRSAPRPGRGAPVRSTRP